MIPGQSRADDGSDCVVRNKESIPPSYADEIIRSEDLDPLPVKDGLKMVFIEPKKRTNKGPGM